MEQETTRETVAAFAERHKLTLDATLVEVGGREGDAHWRVTIHNGSNSGPRTLGQRLSTDYSMGSAHRRWKVGGFLPAAGAGSLYDGARKGEPVSYGTPRTLHDEAYLRDYSEPTPPDLAEVLDSLRLDAECGGADSFEDFAAEYGYDEDSRKAEAIYRACQKIRSDLRRLLGSVAFTELLETERL